MLVHYVSLRSEILTAINIKTADCRDVTTHISKNLLPHPLNWRWTQQVPQKNIFNNLPSQAGSHLRRPVLKLGPCFTVCPLQAKRYSASTLRAQAHTLLKFLHRRQYGTADIMLAAYSSLCSWSFQIHRMHGQTSAADCYKYAAFTFRSIQLNLTFIGPCIIYILIVQLTRCTCFSNYLFL